MCLGQNHTHTRQNFQKEHTRRSSLLTSIEVKLKSKQLSYFRLFTVMPLLLRLVLSVCVFNNCLHKFKQLSCIVFVNRQTLHHYQEHFIITFIYNNLTSYAFNKQTYQFGLLAVYILPMSARQNFRRWSIWDSGTQSDLSFSLATSRRLFYLKKVV